MPLFNEFPPIFWLFAATAVVLLGISKSGFGSGFGSLAVPIMAMATTIPKAVAILLPLLCLMDALAVWSYRKNFNLRLMAFAIPFGLVGTIVGAWLFSVLNTHMVSALVGGLTLVFLLQRLVTRHTHEAWPRPVGAALTTLSGFTSFISHAGGPPFNAYFLTLKLAPVAFAANASLFFAAINLAKWGPYAWLGLLNWQYFVVSLILAPLAPLGVWLGVNWAKRINAVVFYRFVYAGMLFTGLKLLWDGLSP